MEDTTTINNEQNTAPAAPPAAPPTEPPAPTAPQEPPSDRDNDARESEIRKLKAELAKAQGAAEAANKEKKRLEREQMTEAQRLEDERSQLAEDAKKYRTLTAQAKAKQVLSGTGLSEDEYAPILELITSEDEGRTESIALELKTILANQAKSLEKAIREKVLKETPPPPAGGKPPEADDLFLQGFNSNYAAMKK